jgi:hypothetical protein
MRNRTHYELDDAIAAVIDARNDAPLPQIRRDILFNLTRRLHEEGLFDRERAGESQKPDRPMGDIHPTDCQSAHEQNIL